jgi:hypothetical protein
MRRGSAVSAGRSGSAGSRHSDLPPIEARLRRAVWRVGRGAFTASLCNSECVHSDDLRVTDGAAAGAWIKPKLEGEVGSVTDLVPKGFEAYARVFHRATDSEGNSVSWADVAKKQGATPHRQMQWHAILGLPSADDLRGSHGTDNQDGAKWTGSDPPIGGMDIETLDALCEILGLHTADPSRCLFGLCTIQSWEESFTRDELKNPLLQLPLDRDYIVLSGPLSSIDQLAYDWPRQREAPNLIWPADHAWLVASEVDFDSTLVGGSAELIEAIVKSPELEAWHVKPADSLTADADKINGPTEA